MIDAFRKETFTLRAIIIVTINDYPALFSLLGQFKRKVGWVECIDGTWHVSLPASNIHEAQKVATMKGPSFGN